MTLPPKVVLASGNPGKLAELERLLTPLGVDVVPQSALGVDEVEETGTTFEENAILKARHAMRATGLPAIADDSGLMVTALGGRPGVYSARFAGPGASDRDNIDRLLLEMGEVGHRAAAFHCVACYVEPASPDPVVAGGTWAGEILSSPRGEGGFGYDPVFLDTTSGRSSAELSAAEKDALSHRAQALLALVDALAGRAGRR